VGVLDILQLKLFVSVSETLSFSKTAERFYISQPTVSHHIKALENELGALLIKRDSHNVSLTDEGKELVLHARRILGELSAAEHRVKGISKGRTGHIRVAVLSSSAYEFSDCLGEMYRRYPYIQTDIDMLNVPETTKAMSRDEYDFYFTPQALLPAGSALEYTLTSKYRLHLFAHKDDAPGIDINDWSTFRDFSFVSVTQEDAMLTRNIRIICENRGWEPDYVNFHNRAEAVVLSVNARVGLAILPVTLRDFYNCPNVVTIPIDGDDAEFQSVIAWPKRSKSLAADNIRRIITQMYPLGGRN